jgi:tetratricopeptide (TPR) repeat protein
MTSRLVRALSRAASALALTGLATLYPAVAAEAPFFDPVLSDPASVCLPDGNRRKLVEFYQRVAAKSETRPFTPPAANKSDGEADAPLYGNLGKLSFKITTASPMAQRYFDQGLRLAYGFNHAEAGRAFRTARKHDPDCAMCVWGEALVLGPNINAPMEETAVAPAAAAVKRAAELAKGTSAREQALIAALAKRYADDPKADRAALDQAYAEAMGEVAKRFPDDHDVQALYAEALMDLTPWDYWEQGGAKGKGKTDVIIAALERVLKRNPDHPGAIHFYIHMVEASSAPQRAVPYAKRLAATMPGAGHLVHMPFHIYYRIGDYKAAIAANKKAVEVDEAYINEAKPQGAYPAAYYPHNVHSLMASAQMAGDGKAAIAAAEKLARVVSAEAARAIPMVQPVAAAPYFAHAQFSAPATILALQEPADAPALVKAMWHYARGVAYAAQKNVAAAQAESDVIARLQQDGSLPELAKAGIPAADVMELARRVVRARIALAEDKLGEARAAFEEAVKTQDQLVYSEPPHWYYPVRQSLGAVLTRMGELDAAADAFRTSLAGAPNNGWALYGLSEVYRRKGQSYGVIEANRRLDKAWAGDKSALDLARL